MPETAARLNRRRISRQRLYEESQKRIACAGAYAELYDKHDGTVTDIHAMSSRCLSLHRDLVQYLADEALHLSASRKFAKEESRRGDHYRLQGVHSGPGRSIQAQRVLIIAPEDAVSGSERPGMVMIDVDLRKQHWATARGEF
jgi:hypothetical protein